MDMVERTGEDREGRDLPSERDWGAYQDEDSQRAFPLAAAAFGAVVFVLAMLIVNWVC
jgi:hypothetical protein